MTVSDQQKPNITLDVDEMNLDQLRDVMKMLMRLMNHEHDRVTQLQDRVLMLEINESGDNT